MSANHSLIIWAGTTQSFELFCAAQAYAWENPGDQVTAEAAKVKSRLLTIENGVAIVTIAGALTNSDDWWVRWQGMTSYSEIREALAEAAERPEVSQIMMDISSPGGAVAGLSDAADFVKKVDKIKPVTAFSDSVAASAAYWLMSSARKQYASSVATVGSIGVMAVHAETTKMDKEYGVNYTIFRSGKYKALGHPKEELSEVAKVEMQSRVDYLDNIFMEAVSDNLGMSMASAKQKIGEGREFIGEQAKDVGLIDKVLSFDEVYASLVKKASKDTKTPGIFTGTHMSSNSEGEELMKKTLSAEAVAAAVASGASLEDVSVQPAEGATAPEAGDTQTSTEASAATSSEESNDKGGAESASTEEGAKTGDENTAEGVEASTQTDDGVVTLLKSQLLEQTEAVVDLKVQLKSVGNELEQMKANHEALEAIAVNSVSKMSLALGHSEGSAEGMTGDKLITEHARVTGLFQKEFNIGGVAVTKIDEKEGANVQGAKVTSMQSRRVKASTLK